MDLRVGPIKLTYKERWALKNWCFWGVVLEKTLESPLDCKDIQPVHYEDQPWYFFGRNDAKAETPVLLPGKSQGQRSLVGYSPWGCKELDMTEWLHFHFHFQRVDASELWCWRRFLRVPWTARRSNQSILKEISPKYSLEVLMLKLKLQYFGHLRWWTDSLVNTLILGKIEGGRR